MIEAVEKAGEYLYRMYMQEKKPRSLREPELCRQKLLQYAESFEELARSLDDESVTREKGWYKEPEEPGEPEEKGWYEEPEEPGESEEKGWYEEPGEPGESEEKGWYEEPGESVWTGTAGKAGKTREARGASAEAGKTREARGASVEAGEMREAREASAEAGKMRKAQATGGGTDRSEVLEARRLLENRMLLQHNLYEVAQIMTNIADELIRCRPMEARYCKQLKHALRTESIFADHFCYLTDNEDDTHAVCMTLYTEKRGGRTAAEAAEVLSVLLGRTLRPTAASPAVINEKPHSFVFAEETKYIVITGFCRAAKEGEVVCGDQYSVLESEKGRMTLLLSDGTGSGEQAKEDSERTLDLMEKFLEAGYDTESAANMVNIAFYAGERELAHPTLDICDMDLYSGECLFLKVGGSTTFVKSGGRVEKIRQETLPLGIFGSIDVKADKRILRDGDYVIMMTDGVLDALQAEECEEFMEEAIDSIEIVNPGEIAEKLLELAIRSCEGHIGDDMTVLVAGIWENSAAVDFCRELG